MAAMDSMVFKLSSTRVQQAGRMRAPRLGFVKRLPYPIE